MTKTLILHLWPANNMAELLDGKTTVFIGNTWDWHPGCHGTTLRLRRKLVDIKWPDYVRGPHAVAQMIAEQVGARLKVKVYKRAWRR
jgi:hypothetical protein